MATKQSRKKAAAEAAATEERRKRNRSFVVRAFAVLILLSALQFVLIFTLGDDSLRPLDRKQPYNLHVTRVLNLNFPYLTDAGFRDFLNLLARRIDEKLGFQVRFSLRRTVLIDNFIDTRNTFFETAMARSFFKRAQMVAGDWRSNFSWLDTMLRDPRQRALLEQHYGTNSNLKQRIRKDFLRQMEKNVGIRDANGNPQFANANRIPASSSAYWALLVGSQKNSDFLVTNNPVFFPSIHLPPDAVTRGGLMITLLQAAERPLGGALACSLYPFLAVTPNPDAASPTEPVSVVAEAALQGFARLMLRRRLTLSGPDCLTYPLFGFDYEAWYRNGRRRLCNSKQELYRF